MKKTFWILILGVFCWVSPSAFAASKSASFQVSCVIPESAQFSAALASTPQETPQNTQGQNPRSNEFGFTGRGTTIKAIATQGMKFYVTENKTSGTKLLTITAA